MIATEKIDLLGSPTYHLRKDNNSASRTKLVEEEKVLKCAIWGRISSEKDTQQASIGNQHDMLRLYAYEKGWHIVAEYEEVISGTSQEKRRKAFLQLIEDMRAKKFDVVIAKEISRFGRSGDLLYKFRNIAKENSIHIITLDNKVNTMENNEYLFGLFAFLAENESAVMSTRIKQSLKILAKKGEFNGSIPPYGYEIINKKLMLRQDDTPNNVQRIFKLYIEGKGTEAIARIFTREKIPTPSQIIGKRNAGTLWHGSSIKMILTNPHYTGDLVQGRTETKGVTVEGRIEHCESDQITIENSHEEIISKSDFNLVQNLIKSRTKNTSKVRGSKHLFTEVSYCKCCGNGMVYRKNRKGYICGNYNKYGKAFCTDHLILENYLKQRIREDLLSQLETMQDKNYLKKVEVTIQTKINTSKKLISTLNKELEKNESKKKRMLNLLSEGEIPPNVFNDYLVEYNSELNRITQKISKCEQENSEELIKTKIDRIQKTVSELLSFKEIDSNVINRFISKIEIDAKGNPQIHYRFAG